MSWPAHFPIGCPLVGAALAGVLGWMSDTIPADRSQDLEAVVTDDDGGQDVAPASHYRQRRDGT
jgi:hypothetical protein